MFDRYLIKQPIGCGLSGTVYLAEHMKLKAKRVIKCISKKQLMYQQFLAEATLLKNLKHPGIPIIYDLEEDEEYLYIIEEYVKGESLKAVMLNQKAISREAVIDITFQICNIIEYLHNIEPFPVLYLDLKPDHIIVCRDCVKIIDFGAAIYMEKEEVDYSFGTPCFAAPEQYNSLKLDSKTDIYAIGCIIFYMLTGKNPSPSNSQKPIFKEIKDISVDYKKIILKCMAENPQNRYKNVTELKKELSVCLNKKNSLIVAVMGSQTRIGVSHIAIGMVSYLNRIGIRAIYEEDNNNGLICHLSHINKSFNETNGVYNRKDFHAIPKYNETICIAKSVYDVIVLDCGCGSEISNKFLLADTKMVILGTKEWELKYAKDCVDELKAIDVQYIFNLCEKKQAYKAAEYLGIKKAYCMPMYTDPFQTNCKSKQVFKDVLKDYAFHFKRRMRGKR